jgi:KTSC domain
MLALGPGGDRMKLVEFENIDGDGDKHIFKIAPRFIACAYLTRYSEERPLRAVVSLSNGMVVDRISGDAAEYLEDFLKRCDDTESTTPDHDRQPVQSSNIASIGWHDGTLEVEFKTGSIYHYEGVSREFYNEFMNAPSKGTFFSRYVKGVYHSRKLEGEPEG